MKGSSLLTFLLITTHLATGQTQSSVYSENGLGLFNSYGEPQYQGMGGVGIGTPNIWHPNQKNFSYLPLNSLTTFQVGLEVDRRNVSSEGQQERRTAGGLRFLNLSFPIISKKWTSSFSLSPFSTVNYKITSLDSLSDGVFSSDFEGSGGITSLSWSNGFNFKNVFVGVRGSYLFGAIDKTVRTDILDDTGTNFLVDFTDQSSYSDFVVSLAGGYRKKLNDNRYLNFGLVYDFPTQLEGTNSVFSQTINRNTGQILEENEVVPESAVQTSIPTRTGLGVSYEILNKLTVGLDVERSFWNEVENEFVDFSVANTTKIGLGAAWTPDFSSINNYFERATYRFGLSYNTLPYTIEGETISDFGINIGGRFPAGPARVSSMDVALQQGWLGSDRNGLVREAYFKIVIGVTINDRWFVKRRYD